MRHAIPWSPPQHAWRRGGKLTAPSTTGILRISRVFEGARTTSHRRNIFLTMKRMAGLLALTAVAVLIHGYHPYAEDAEIYLPGVLKILDPSLFPGNTEFFGQHAGHTAYPNLIAGSVRLTHLPLPWVVLLWQIA